MAAARQRTTHCWNTKPHRPELHLMVENVVGARKKKIFRPWSKLSPSSPHSHWASLSCFSDVKTAFQSLLSVIIMLVSSCHWGAHSTECEVGCQTPGARTSPYMGPRPALESRASALWWCGGRRSVWCLSVCHLLLWHMFVNISSSVIISCHISVSIILSVPWIALNGFWTW